MTPTAHVARPASAEQVHSAHTNPVWAVRDARHPLVRGQCKLVLILLASRMNTLDDEAWPTIDTLAEDAGIGQTITKRAIAELVAAGVLVRRVTKTKTGRRNHYRIAFNVLLGSTVDQSHVRPTPSVTRPTDGSDTPMTDGSVTRPTKKIPSKQQVEDTVERDHARPSTVEDPIATTPQADRNAVGIELARKLGRERCQVARTILTKIDRGEPVNVSAKQLSALQDHADGLGTNDTEPKTPRTTQPIDPDMDKFLAIWARCREPLYGGGYVGKAQDARNPKVRDLLAAAKDATTHEPRATWQEFAEEWFEQYLDDTYWTGAGHPLAACSTRDANYIIPRALRARLAAARQANDTAKQPRKLPPNPLRDKLMAQAGEPFAAVA